MSKNKKRSIDTEEEQKDPRFIELRGVILILLAILGIGKYGFVGKLVSAFAIFLVGVGYNISLALFGILGFYYIIKRDKPKFFSPRFIGFYIICVGILIFTHFNYIELNNGETTWIFQATLNDLMISFQNMLELGVTDITGGGIIGCIFAVLFNVLFALEGTKIVSIVFMALGFVMITGVSIFDLIKNGFNKAKDKVRNNKENNESKVVIEDHNKDESPVQVVAAEAIKPDVKVKYNYILPSINLLDMPKKKVKTNSNNNIEKNISMLEKTLLDFSITAKVVAVHVGPAVTQYELEIMAGTKVSKIVSLNKEIALSLAKKDVRIQAPIPGKNTIGIEMANDNISTVSFREVVEKVPVNKAYNKLLVPLGKNIMGEVIWCEIDKTPHLLVAGATGSGKSVCINGIITSILMRAKPDEVKLVLVDPKKVELSGYNGVPHLMCPVVTDPKKASVALAKIVSEMERRYDVFEENHVKNIGTYNDMIDKKNKNLSEDNMLNRMPYIVVIVDELADLMMVASKEVEDSIMRITQMARAAGIHLIIATQRPSTDVITGIIKANIPSRISFAVSSGIDSRTILDMQGAEKLLGKGDMLFLPMGEGTPQRVQGAFIADDEIKRVIDHTVEQQKAQYDENLLNLQVPDNHGNHYKDLSQEEDYDDPLYNDIVDFITVQGKASASLLQRRFKLGYNRAARIIDLLEERGVIGPQNGSKPREVLLKKDEEDEE